MPCFTLYSLANSKYKLPGGDYIRRGDLTEGFLRYDFGRLIFGGAYTRRALFLEFYGIYLKDWIITFTQIQTEGMTTKLSETFKQPLRKLVTQQIQK